MNTQLWSGGTELYQLSSADALKSILKRRTDRQKERKRNASLSLYAYKVDD